MNKTQKMGGAVAALMVAAGANAAPVDLSTLIAGVDLSTVTPAILAVAVLILAPRIAKYAVRVISGFFPK